MKPKFLLLIILPFIAQNTLAAQCPDISDWSHVKGQPWVLSAKAQAAGWQAMSEDHAVNNDLTTVPADKRLVVGLMATAHRFTTCGYTLETGDSENVIAAINDQDPVDLKKLTSSFICFRGHCACATTAGAPEVCVWEWKK